MDLSVYEKPLLAMQASLDSRREAVYCQIQARGADRVDLRLRQGKLEHISSEAGIVVSTMVAQKKGAAWRKSERVLRGLCLVDDYEVYFSELLQSSAPSKDPRPPFVPAVPSAALDRIKRSIYDPTVARGQASQVFHRLYQSLGQALQEGWQVDADVAWINGRDAFNLRHPPFAYADNRSVSFFPETRIDESFTLYRQDRPGHRRVLAQTRNVAAYPVVFSELLVELDRCSKRPFLALNARNIERVIFKPKAVAAFVRAYLLEKAKQSDVTKPIKRNDFGEEPILSETLWLRNDPEHLLFGAMPLNNREAASSLIAGGRWLAKPGAAMAYPVLEASNDGVEAPFEQVLKEASRLLVIEDAHFLWPNETSAALQIFLPAGGVLYDQGQAVGHLAAIAFAAPQKSIFGRAQAIDIPQRMGALAICGLEIPAADFIDAARGAQPWA